MEISPPNSACPACREPLEPQATAHGLVWVCRRCHGLAANLAVLRKIAPRLFVKHLWLAALESGVPSARSCPSCERPLLGFGPEVEVSPRCEICRRCFLLWFDAAALPALRSRVEGKAARRVLGDGRRA